MVNARVITVFLLLLGAEILRPDWVQAQESGGEVVDLPEVEAAHPADSGEHEVFQFLPRAAVEDEASAAFSAFDSATADDLGQSGADAIAPENEGAWSATERFSSRNFLETIPVQYPLDNNAYEGEDPTGQDPQDVEGDWRSSSVDRPEEALRLEDQPWIDWYKLTLQSQVIPSGGEGMGITSFDLRGTLKFARWPFLFVTPRAGLHFVDGPSTTDLPARLFDYSLDATVYLPLNERWTVQASATPSLFTDLKAFQNSFRMVGRGLVFYRWSPELQLVGGFVYLGRKDIVALPAAGFIYTPNDYVKLDVMFPKPRAAIRYTHDDVRERWIYVSGELGGGSWAVQRASGNDDVVAYRDFQFLLGHEHKETGALNWQVEAGYVFARKLEYFSGVGDTDLSSSAVLRLILSY